MTERYIPESAVRELEAVREQAYSAESSDEAALIMAGGIDALLATAAPQDEAPEEGEALALEVRELARRYSEHLPAGFRASLGLLLSGRGKPAPEPEGLREAAAEVVNGTTALTPDRACVRVPRESWRRLRDTLARSAPEPEGLREALVSIQQYATDLLAGNEEGPTGTRWLRDGVREISREARAALARPAAAEGVEFRKQKKAMLDALEADTGCEPSRSLLLREIDNLVGAALSRGYALGARVQRNVDGVIAHQPDAGEGVVTDVFDEARSAIEAAGRADAGEEGA
jgi:hypothetical protein